MANFLKHLAAIAAGAGPILIVLEAAPGPVGKAACVAVSVLSALGLLRTQAPASAPKGDA